MKWTSSDHVVRDLRYKLVIRLETARPADRRRRENAAAVVLIYAHCCPTLLVLPAP